MKLIKIKKHSRNSQKTFYIFLEDFQVILDGKVDEENVNHHVNERCAKDPAGHSYGWEFEWEIVTDKEEIELIAKKEIKSKERNIDNIKKEIDELEKFL